MICPKCGFQNPADTEFCLSCAATLMQTCPSCGQVVPPASRFCNHCGARLDVSAGWAPPPSPGHLPPAHVADLQSLRALMPSLLAKKMQAAAVEIAGQRREVTVLFMDIADYTATAHKLDSEDVYLMVNAVLQRMTEVVYKYEGTIDKYIGDGLMALFGVPVAHENDPERAVRAGLEMQAVLVPLQEHFDREYNFRLAARIGLNTGVVIAGDIGNDLHMEYTVIGDTVNLASRLETTAAPETVVVSYPVYQRTRALFEYQALPLLEVKGKPEPIRVFRPLRPLTNPGSVRGLLGLRVPMVGRQDALARLQLRWAEVCQRHQSQIAFISGEAGMGKSRLVAEFAGTVTGAKANFYQASCQTYTRTISYWLIANMLRNIFYIAETDSHAVQSEKLRRYLGQLELDANELSPYLFHLLGIEQPDPAIEMRLQHLESIVLQKLIHEAVRRLFFAQVQLAPTILVFDDLHWVDPASRDFLEHLIQTIDDVPLLLILVSRPAERETVMRPLLTVVQKLPDRMVDIQLQPLTKSEGQLLVDQLIDQTTPEARLLKQKIIERSGGNPFYTEEIVRMLIEDGGLIGEFGAWEVTPEAQHLLQQVPGTLNGLIFARFDRLSEALRKTLQIAAVLGSSFPVKVLHTLRGINLETVREQLHLLEAQYLVQVMSRGADSDYVFGHALIQDVIYSTLLKRDRQTIHEQAAQVIEHDPTWPADTKTNALAFHYAESSTPAKAIPYLITAAESAIRHNTHEAAIPYYRRALELMREQPMDNQYFRAQMGLGQALKFVGEFSEAKQILEVALKAVLSRSLKEEAETLLPILVKGLRELADTRVREGAPEEAAAHLEAGLAALGQNAAEEHRYLWRSLMDRLAWVRFRQGKLDDTFRLASAATLDMDVANESDPTSLASLYNTLGGVFWQWGDLNEASHYVKRSLSMYEGLGYAWGMAIAYTNLGVLHYALGLWPEAVDYFEQAYALRRDNGYLSEQALNLNNLGVVRRALGDHVQARNDLEASLSISRRLGDEFGIVLAEVGLAHLAVIQASYEEAAEHIGAVLSMSEAAGEEELIETRWLQALVFAKSDRLEMGLELVNQALQQARDVGLTKAEADCCRTLGILNTLSGDYWEAETRLQESIDLYLQLKDAYGQGLGMVALGQVYAHLADVVDETRFGWQMKAVKALNTAIGLFEQLGAAYDLEIASSIMNRVQSQIITKAQLRKLQSQKLPDATHDLPEGEWRMVVVVWLRFYVPPSVDEEDAFMSIVLAESSLAVIVKESQGQIIKRQDGLTVVFGASLTREDDAERAIQAAQHIAQHLDNSEYPTPLVYKMVASQGKAIVGQMDSHIRTELRVEGDPLDLARRAIDVVVPGKVWVTEDVRAATMRRFIYEEVPSDATLSQAGVMFWELAGERQHPAPARGLWSMTARLIGREDALRSMINLSDRLRQNVGGIVWIEGEAGIGKSRLMQEFADFLATRDILIWNGRCTHQKSAHPFALFASVLAQAFSVQTTDDVDQIRIRIEQTIQTWTPEMQALRPYLEVLLGVAPGGLDGERLSNLGPEQLRQQLFVALRKLFVGLSEHQNLVVFLDDLHWVDSLSADLLLFVMTIVTSAPVLFVCSQRQGEADHVDTRLSRIANLIPDQTVRLYLDRLSIADSETLLAELLPDLASRESIYPIILERSEGNPFFIEEFVRMFIEQGYLQRTDGQLVLDSGLDLSSIALPSSLEALIRSRIDILPAELKQLVQYAAIIGGSFEMRLLEFLMKGTAIADNLRQLEGRLLICRGNELNQWQFNHITIENVVYQTMLKAQRQALHLQVGQALEYRWAGAQADHAEELSFHFTQAGESSKALTYLVLAGERAAARYANEEAVSFYEQAAQLLGSHIDVPDNVRWDIATGLGDVYRSLGRYDDSLDALKTGLALTRFGTLPGDCQVGLFWRLGETNRQQGELEEAYTYFVQALQALGDPVGRQKQSEAARILHGLAWVHFLQGHFEVAQQACEASMVHARAAEALNELASAENLLGGIYYRQGELNLASSHTMRAMVLREQMGHTWGVASTLNNLGVLAVSSGQWRKAWSFFERGLTLRTDMGDVDGVALAHTNLGMLAQDQGDLAQAERHFRDGLTVAKAFNMGFHIANVTVSLARVYLLQGEIATAKATAAEGLAHSEAIGVQHVLAEAYRVQAEILLAESAWEEARAVVGKAVAIASQIGGRSLEMAALRITAEIALQQGQYERAHQMLARAQEILVEVTEELEMGRLTALAGRIHLCERDFTQAENDFRVAKETFMRLGAALDLRLVEEASRQCYLAKAQDE